MESALLCLVLVSLSGSCWERRVAALSTHTVQVRVGGDAVLQCPLLDNTTTTTTSTLSWYRKDAGQRPQLLLSVRPSGSVAYGTGFGPDKASTASDGSLLLRRCEPRDSAVYYCSVSQGGGRLRNPPRHKPAEEPAEPRAGP